MFKNELRGYVNAHPNLVSVKEAGDGLFVLKYKKKVFYDGLWNRFVSECRGTIIDSEFNVISRPFTKIFNYGIEKEAPCLSDDTMVDAYRKINGFMVAVTWHKGDLLISTTGSTSSEFVDMARELIDMDRYKDVCARWQGTTFMFECVHANDPHIIPEKVGMYLLGYRETSWGPKVSLDPMTLRMLEAEFRTVPVEHYRMNIRKLKDMAKVARHEGFVAYTDAGQSFKIKSPYYLIKKFVARNPRTDKLMRPDIKNSIDEEYYPLIDHIQANITEYTAMDEQARLAWVRNFFETQT